MSDVRVLPDADATTIPGNVLHQPTSAYAREMVKWEAQNSLLGTARRPYAFREYPMMLHLAAQLPGGGVGITETETVDEPGTGRERLLRSRGFRETPLEALKVLTATQDEFAKLAAEREWEKKHRLSAKAVAEVNAAEEAAGAQHLPTIPERPKRKYVRKVAKTASEG